MRVEDTCGVDLTPKETRVRALLALLAEPPLRKRSRRWLAAHLWSDRPFRKSSMNLRQALVVLRRALGDHVTALCADRSDVWLDPTLVAVDLSGSMTLLEGIDIQDEAFEEWLRALRAANDPRPDREAPSSVLSILARVGSATSPAGRVTAGVIADQVSQNLEDMIGSIRTAKRRGRNGIEVSTHISETNDSALLQARVMYGPDGTVLFSGHRTLPKQGTVSISPEEIAAFSHTAARRALAKLPHVAALDRDEVIALGFAEVGRRRLLSYEPGAIDAAGSHFAQAFDADPSGVFLAWQAFQRTAQVIEAMVDPAPDLLEEVDGFLRRATELSPESAQTWALTAFVRLLLFDDTSTALSAAEAGLRRNPSCLLSRQALAVTAGALGDKQAAYRATSFCRPALADDDGRHLWDLYHGLVCIATRRYDEAFTALRSASRRCPSFKAPHRQLIALSLYLGDPERARRHLAALQRLEPEFSLDSYVRDDAYPAATLRSAGLLDQRFDELC